MSHPVNGPDAAVRTLEHELGLVESAIAMVASGTTPAVSLAGLRFGDQLIDPALTMAGRVRVRVVPLWTADESGAGIRFERIDGD